MQYIVRVGGEIDLVRIGDIPVCVYSVYVYVDVYVDVCSVKKGRGWCELLISDTSISNTTYSLHLCT